MKTKMCRRGLVAGVALATVLGTGACGQSTAADVPDNVVTATVELSGVDMEILQAYNILLKQCARTKGFDVPIDYTVPAVTQSYADVGGIFRSKEEAQTVGYSTKTADLTGENEALNAYLATLSDTEKQRYDREVTGENPNDMTSCSAQANAIVFGSPQEASAILNTFNDLIREQSSSALDDADVQSAIMDKYVPCMKKAGYEVQGLRGTELAQQKFGRYRKWNEQPNAEEKAMATQDYQCQVDANLMQRINDALERNAGTWMVANEAMLLERHEKLQQAREIANEVISGKRTFEARD